MVEIKLHTSFNHVLCIVLLLSTSRALRHFNRRNDPQDVPAIADSGYFVPLYGDKTCFSPDNCTSSLPPPAFTKTLRALTIACGSMVYSCADADPSNTPSYLSQSTALYDAAPLILLVPDELTFHTLVPQLYDYDYPKLKNSSLICIGNIYTEYGETIVNLGSIGVFPIEIRHAIPPPTDPEFDAWWAHSTSIDGCWDVYRVETANGAVPSSCEGLNTTFEIDYAAEYWFYQ